MTFYDYRLNRELKNGYKEFANILKPTHFITLATNASDGTVSREKIHKVFKRTLNSAHHLLNGRAWSHMDDKKIHGLYVAEHPDTNIHIHILANIPDQLDPEAVAKALEKRWTHYIKGGTIDFQKIYSLDAVTNYILKDFKNERSEDQPTAF